MTTQIVCGNSNPISEMWRMLSGISTILTSPSHMPSPLIQKSGWSCLLRYIHTAFLSTTWKLIFRRGVVLLLRFTFFFAFLFSICPTLLNAFPSHDEYYFFPLLPRWSSWLRTLIFYSASFRRTASFLCSDNFRYLPRTIYLIELPPTFYHYIAWSVRSTP